MVREFYYNHTTTLVDSSFFEGDPVLLPVDSSEVEIPGYDGVNSYAHVGLTTTQVHTPSVAWQLSNNEQLPGQSVSAEDLLKQYPYTTYKLSDSRDSSSGSGSGSGGSSSGGSTIDASSILGGIWALDENANQIPDAMEWNVL